MKIERICVAEVRAPLPAPLRLGPAVIETRDYVALRLETDAGITGEALGYVRGTPLVAALKALGPQILGRDPMMRAAVLGQAGARNPPGRAAFTRAISLIDIACWDILAKQAREPLYRLLGGLRAGAPATAVAGYFMDVRSLGDIADEARRRVDEGFSRVKIMLKGDDAAFDLEYVRQLAAAAPGRLAADAHWTWLTLTDALRFCRRLDPEALQFLEDPFAAEDWSLARPLAQATGLTIAMGEDMAGPAALARAANDVGLLRVDATTCGGVSGAVAAVHLAAAAGRNVFPHVFAPLHVHLACAFPNVEGVEIIPEETGADPLSRVLRRPPRLDDGCLHASEEPGIGLELDWPAIEAAAFEALVVAG